MNLKINQIIKHKDGREIKVIGICGEAIILDSPFSHCWSNRIATEKELLVLGYIIPEEVWKPKDNDMYFFISETGEVGWYYWGNDETDRGIRNFFGVYPTEQAAQKALEEIKSKLGK